MCTFCPSTFKSEREVERHENSSHLRRQSWSCKTLIDPEAAFRPLPYEDHMCLYCGTLFSSLYSSYEGRARHLTEVHSFRICHLSKFFEADDFRQHLEHSHAASPNEWSNMLENACMEDEVSLERRVVASPALELAPVGLPGPLVEKPELRDAVSGDPPGVMGRGATIPNPLLPIPPIDSPRSRPPPEQKQCELSQSDYNNHSPKLSHPRDPQAATNQNFSEDETQTLARSEPKQTLPVESDQPRPSFRCLTCQRSFSRRTILENHQRTHTREKPFACKVPGCDKSFAQQSDRTRHGQSQHGEKSFICGGARIAGLSWGCGRAFARKDGLLEHHRKTGKGRKCFAEGSRVEGS
jgi:hypothetical protein